MINLTLKIMVKVTLSLCIVPHHVAMSYMRVKVQLHVFLTRHLLVLINKLVAYLMNYQLSIKRHGHAVAQLVEALRYKSEGRGFDSRWCHWNFSLT